MSTQNNATSTPVEQPKATTDNAWIEPYYKLNKEELVSEVDPVTLNQIRNTLGDQKFIDQWKLSEADYNKIIDGQQNQVVTEEPLKEYIPTSTIYSSGVHPAGTVRRVYSGHSGLYGGRSYYGGYPYHGSHYSGSHYGSYYGGYPYHNGTHYGGYPYHGGVTRVIAADEGIRRSIVRTEAPVETTTKTTEAPVVTKLEAPVTRVIANDSTLRTSYIGAPIRRSYVRGDLPVSSRVISGDNVIRSSYVAPVTYANAPVSYAHAGSPVYTSTIGAPVTYTASPVGASYIRSGAPTLRHSSYLVDGGHYPVTTLRSSAYHPSASYYPTSTRVVNTEAPVVITSQAQKTGEDKQ